MEGGVEKRRRKVGGERRGVERARDMGCVVLLYEYECYCIFM